MILMLVPLLTLFAQSFEVASVKLHPGNPHSINITTSGPLLKAEGEMVAGLVLYAYDLKNYQLAWVAPKPFLDEMFFDIEAKAEGDVAPKPNDFRKMMQSLLADRFKLQVHYEKREMQVLALVLAKNGPKFKESAPDAAVSGRHGVSGRNQSMTLTKATMESFAQQLPVYAGRPVVDRTGLTGTYDIKLEATPAFRTPEPGDTSVFQAIQDQLGLKLEAQKAMIDVLVVDRVEKPSVN